MRMVVTDIWVGTGKQGRKVTGMESLMYSASLVQIYLMQLTYQLLPPSAPHSFPLLYHCKNYRFPLEKKDISGLETTSFEVNISVMAQVDIVIPFLVPNIFASCKSVILLVMFQPIQNQLQFGPRD